MQHPDLDRLTGPDRRRLGLGAVPAVLAAVVAVTMAITWPTGDIQADTEILGVTDQVYRATVQRADVTPCSYDADQDCLTAVFVLEEGPTPGTRSLQEFPLIPSTPRFEVGEGVVLNYLPEADPSFQYQFADRERRGLLLGVGLAFVVAVVALGRLRGLAAIGGLVASVVVLVGYIVPAILQGTSPVLVASVGAGAIGFIALYLAHGFGPLTHVAVIGTMGALAVTVALSWMTVAAARFSGLAGEESLALTVVGDFDVRGLLLAGIVLGALGALDDVTVTQASAVWEIRRADPRMPRARLFAAGLRVGRDHIASTVNTLLLAYAGASMPLLLLFALSGQPLGIVANSEVVATEIVRTLVGSIGLVTAVPITTWLAASIVSRIPATELRHVH